AVALKNLEIKENALSQLDVPFKIKVGHIGNLSLIIPWKNLYTQPVEALLEDIYLLIVPSSRIKYDPLKEEKQLFEAKQQELKRIEEAKRKVADQEKHQVEKQDTFTEKLITQIIKNLQVKISNIHIRYEDDVTNRDNPLSFGISLQNLSMQTTDQYWIPCLHDETEKLFRKDSLRNGIADESIIPEGYDFVFRPISANAKLQMNRGLDFDFSVPKISLDVELHDITIEFNKPQYFSLMELLESVDVMTQNLPYRKFKPDVPLHYHAKEWSWKRLWIFETKIGSFHVTGLPDNSTKPRLLSSLDDAASLLRIIFEINPLDETVAQRDILCIRLWVTSKIRSELRDLKQGGAKLEEIMCRAYDSFDIQLTSIQLLYSRVGDNWKEARKLNVSTQHILVPMHFNVELSKAMVFMDIRMP
ncbi:hypothetical protein E2I00_008914, partial [Balaenoptera physalus]